MKESYGEGLASHAGTLCFRLFARAWGQVACLGCLGSGRRFHFFGCFHSRRQAAGASVGMTRRGEGRGTSRELRCGAVALRRE